MPVRLLLRYLSFLLYQKVAGQLPVIVSLIFSSILAEQAAVPGIKASSPALVTCSNGVWQPVIEIHLQQTSKKVLYNWLFDSTKLSVKIFLLPLLDHYSIHLKLVLRLVFSIMTIGEDNDLRFVSSSSSNKFINISTLFMNTTILEPTWRPSRLATTRLWHLVICSSYNKN
jgi:hypothetical protein